MTLSKYDYTTDYFIFNSYHFKDKDTQLPVICVEGLPVGKSSKYPKKLFLNEREAEKYLGHTKGEDIDTFVKSLRGCTITVRSDVTEAVTNLEKS